MSGFPDETLFVWFASQFSSCQRDSSAQELLQIQTQHTNVSAITLSIGAINHCIGHPCRANTSQQGWVDLRPVCGNLTVGETLCQRYPHTSVPGFTVASPPILRFRSVVRASDARLARWKADSSQSGLLSR